jgi:CheY-like chemotaxis protein
MKHSSESSILVIEDDEPKLKSIVALLEDRVRGELPILIASSLSSAVRTLSTTQVLLAIVDMSLPTFDMSAEHSGGQPQGFGGADILRFIESESPNTKSVVVTQYEEFPSGPDGVMRDLARLESDLRSELSSRFLGVIHYTGRQGAWRNLLVDRLDSLGFEEKK